MRHKDGLFRWLSWTAVPDRDRIYAVARDVTEIKAAEEELRSSRQELARVGRLMTMAAITASIAHEVAQPIAAARNNARAALNFLNAHPPDLGEVREALSCVVGDADRAAVIIDRIRDHVKKAPPRKDRFDLNEAINEVIVIGARRNHQEWPSRCRPSDGRAVSRCGGSCSIATSHREPDPQCGRSNGLGPGGATRVVDQHRARARLVAPSWQ